MTPAPDIRHAGRSGRAAGNRRDHWGTAAAVLLPLLAAFAAVCTIQLLLSPGHGDRAAIGWLVGVPAAGSAIAALVFRRWIARSTRLASVVVALVSTGSALVIVSVGQAASRMFLSSHDAKLVAVAVVLGAALSSVLTLQALRPLGHQVRRLGVVAQQVAAGDLTGRTGIERRDELGEAARAVDHMVARLAFAEDARTRLEGERRFLLSSIGHDLRTPLAALRATVESLQDGVAPDPVRYLAAMGTQLDAVESLIDDLAVYARIEAGRLQFEATDIDLAELVDGTLEAMAPLAHRRGVTIRATGYGPALVRGGAAELARAVRNLVDNALRYGPVGSTVTVALSVDGAVTRTARPMARLVVADEGPGFPPEFRAQAFEPFTRADPARDRSTGTAGLGLAIARGIVRAHDGTIAIGEVHRGGCIEVRLPLHAVPLDAERPHINSAPRTVQQ